MDMGSMDMGNGTMMMSSGMAMVFFNSHTTPLYSEKWTPSSTGAYAGTCIFLVMLSIIFRALLAAKHILQVRWKEQAYNRRYIVVADKLPMSEQIQRDPDAKTGVLTANGVEESVRVVHHAVHGPAPWRFSVDLPRAALITVLAGVGYLLMLAIMTFNIGYFISVLAGVFVGDLMIGRYHSAGEGH